MFLCWFGKKCESLWERRVFGSVLIRVKQGIWLTMEFSLCFGATESDTQDQWLISKPLFEKCLSWCRFGGEKSILLWPQHMLGVASVLVVLKAWKDYWLESSRAMTTSLQVPIKFTLMATIMVYKKNIEREQGTKDLIREEKLNDCSAQRTLDWVVIVCQRKH